MTGEQQADIGNYGEPLNEKLVPLWQAFLYGVIAGSDTLTRYPPVEVPRELRKMFERWVAENVLVDE